MKLLFVVLISMLFCVSLNAADIELSDISGGSEELFNFRKVDEGERFSFTLRHSTGEVFAKNMPFGARLTSVGEGTWEFDWIPADEQSGEYTIGFYTHDSNNLVYKNVRVLVADTKFMITAQEEFSYLFTATDPDEDDVELTITNLPTGAIFVGSRFNPKIFSWTPTEDQVGIHTMTLIATDNPSSGTPKQDVSIIEMNVTLLSKASMPFDFNRDGIINMIDYAIFSEHWLRGSIRSDAVVPITIVPTVSVVTTELTEEEKLNAVVVYKVASGTEYHKVDCIYSVGRSIRGTIGEYKADGLEPCTRCQPDDVNYVFYSKKSIGEILRDALPGVE